MQPYTSGCISAGKTWSMSKFCGSGTVSPPPWPYTMDGPSLHAQKTTLLLQHGDKSNGVVPEPTNVSQVNKSPRLSQN